jgi:hypothetical protein
MLRSKVVVAGVLALFAFGAVGCSSKKKSEDSASKEDDDEKSSGSDKGSDKTATLTKRFPAVGDKVTETDEETTDMSGTVSSKGKEEDLKVLEKKTVEKTEECLAVTDKTCTKLKVTYAKYDRKETVNGKEKDKGKDLAGKTLIVELKGEELTITKEDGSKADIMEEITAKKDFKGLKRRHKFIEALPDKVKVGDSLDGIANALLEAAAEDGDKAPKTKSAKATVKSIREEGGKTIVTIDVKLSFEDDKDGMKISAEMNGTVDIRADGGHQIAGHVTGPMTIESSEGLKMSVKGTMTMKETSKPSW